MKKRFHIPNFNIYYILLFAFLLRFILSFFGTLNFDQGTFIAWGSNLANNGFKNFYNGWCDYLPGYLYVLWLLGKINLLNIIPEVILYKLPAIIADLTTGYLIYKIISKYKNPNWGAVGAIIYLFNPAVFANSALWGQVDSLTSLMSISAIYFIGTSTITSAVMLSVGTLIKPQAAFILPVIIFVLIKKNKKLYEIAVYCLIGLGVFMLGFLPFSKGDFINFIIHRLSISANQYPYTSVNAFNFWGLFGFWNYDNIYIQFASYFLVLASTVVLFFRKNTNKLLPYFLISFVFAASFIFFTRMHERHLLPLFAPLTVIAVDNPLFIVPYIIFSLTYILNLIYSYYWITGNFVSVFSGFIIKFVIISNILALTYMVRTFVNNRKISWSGLCMKFTLISKYFKKRIYNGNSKDNYFSTIKLSKSLAKKILYIILIFAFVTRIFNFDSPPTMYFDEVYHAFTAKVMLGVDRAKAWEWWNTPPQDFAYEWTHPPLAKLGMALGMLVFGQTSFGWRLPGALLGVGSVFLVYLLAKKIFNDEAVGLISAGAFSLDGLPLVMSRIGMNDSYILFFSLLSIYLFMRQKDLYSALAYGLAISSKWSALWAIPIIIVIWLKRKKKFTKSILWFAVVPVIYLLSYLPMFITGHSLNIWWGMQEQMWWYHTNLRATHPYSSPWWSWPFLIRPIYLYTSDEVGGFVSRIYAMGNPLVFWFGVVSVAVSAIYSYLEKNKNLGFVVFSYLIFFVPWSVSPRIMFLYHYLPSIPFMCIAIGYILRKNLKLIYVILPVFMIAFIYFYPHWTGLTIPLWLDKSYYWVNSWR